jgi:protein-S-isoprenylcysteine O-methyltransferase Ste14
MANKIPMTNIFNKIKEYLLLLISMAGYVPSNATLFRSVAMLSSFAFAFYLGNFQPGNSTLAIVFFILSEIFYLGFINVVLSENGLRHWFIKKWGNENDGYKAYEGVLGFLFFLNGVSIGYIASATPGDIFDFVPENILFVIVTIMFVGGFLIKIFAAKAVTIDIYYWKDMFLGRKICDFVVSGPYKYFSNPMYGIGQLQAYASAIWYGSAYGLIAAFINQSLIFLFYYQVEKKFIKRVYGDYSLQPEIVKVQSEEFEISKLKSGSEKY